MARGLLAAVAAVAAAVALVAAVVLGPVAVPAAANAAGQARSASSANGEGEVRAMSCASGGTCAAGGDYFDASSKNQQAFVVTELAGRWGSGVEVPGLAADHSKESTITAISCAAGACTAGGWWKGAKANFHAFVTTEQNGKWSRLTSVLAQKKAARNVTHVLEINSVSCAAPRNGSGSVLAQVNAVACAQSGKCVAGGVGFVADENHGTWGQAQLLLIGG